MLSTIAKRSQIQEHISEYLDMMAKGEEIVVLEDERRDGRYQELGRFLPRCQTVRLAAEKVMGILRSDIDVDQVREEALREKYGLDD